jgi:DNA polymerase I
MLIELRKGMTLHPGTFKAVIAPGKVMVSALNLNTDLQRFLFLYVGGNYSRLLSSINRSSRNFEVRRAFTAHQLFTILKEVSHTVVLLEHDPTLFDGAENADDISGTTLYRSSRSLRNGRVLPYAQQTLEVS